MNRSIWRHRSLEMAKEKSSSSAQSNVRHFVCGALFRTNTFHSGILVRNDAAKEKLKQRLNKRSMVMSVLMFPCYSSTSPIHTGPCTRARALNLTMSVSLSPPLPCYRYSQGPVIQLLQGFHRDPEPMAFGTQRGF